MGLRRVTKVFNSNPNNNIISIEMTAMPQRQLVPYELVKGTGAWEMISEGSDTQVQI